MHTPPAVRLPASILSMVQVIGISAALSLVRERGGIRLYVPLAAHADHPISEMIGIERMQDLVRVYGGEEVEIPRCASALKAQRDHEIGERHDAGASQTELARAYQMTERNIKKILAARRAGLAEDQLDLFGGVLPNPPVSVSSSH